MGIILKENNLIHTKMRHEKFMGSSCYRFDRAKNTIYKKEKVNPKLPKLNEQDEDIDKNNEFRELINEFYSGDNHKFSRFTSNSKHAHHVEPETVKRAKKTEYKLNKKKVREKCSAFFGLKQSRKFLAFYSISFPQSFPDFYAFKCLNTVLTRLRKKCGLKSYLWITERQKNGTIHFHMLTNNYMYIRKVNHYMAKAIETQIKKHNIDVVFDVRKYNGVDVRHVNNNRKLLLF